MYKKLIANPAIRYILSRYITYIIQLINSIFIAVYLGPIYLGIWGFINLIIQYFGQLNFGIPHSVTAIASVYKSNKKYVSKIATTAISMLILLTVFILLFFVGNHLFDIKIGNKFSFSKYAPLVFLIAVLGNFNNLLSNIFRIYGRLFEIAFYQSIFPVLVLIALFLFKGDDLLWALIIANCIALILSLILFLIRSPIKLKLVFNIKLAKKIQQKGWHLFIYNSSFYLIIISTRSIISVYYEISEFGYFTFAFSMANTIFLLFESFSYLIFPKLLNRFATNSNQQIANILEMVRNSYITISHLLIHIAIFLFPIFLSFFPKYEQASKAFSMIALTIVLYTSSYGYQGLLIAKGEEKKLGMLAFLALCFNIISALFLVLKFNISFFMVIISTMFTYFIYVYFLCAFGRVKLNLPSNFMSVFKDVYPYRLFISYAVSLCLVIYSAANIYFIIPIILTLFFNYKELIKLKDLVNKIITNPNFINI